MLVADGDEVYGWVKAKRSRVRVYRLSLICKAGTTSCLPN
jgi:hypothetical protein